MPAQHGAKITYRCSRKYAKEGGNVNALCQDGKITFDSDDDYTPCFKIGKDYSIYLLSFIIEQIVILRIQLIEYKYDMDKSARTVLSGKGTVEIVLAL